VTPAIGRVALGLLGVAAGVVFWLQPPRGWVLYMAWALIQIPVYAWRPEGSPTTQVLSFPLSATSSTDVNGVVTSYSEIGINLVGVILAIWLAQRREKLTRSD
jgi:hypothetical protein